MENTKCDRCGKKNPAEIHTCTPGFYFEKESIGQTIYEPIKKKYSLNRSYFKLCYGEQPKTPYECLDYYNQHGERPFTPFGKDEKEIIFNMFTEYQKRNSYDMKSFDQFYTPLNTAERLTELIREYGKPITICDACCGYGSITQFITAPNYYEHQNIYAFDLYEKNNQPDPM